MTVVVSVGLMFSHDDFAVFSKVKGVTIFTVAGHAVILIVSEIGTGVDGQIGIWQGGGICKRRRTSTASSFHCRATPSYLIRLHVSISSVTILMRAAAQH